MISVDGIPIIDTLPGAQNMLVGVGWSGHGWAISPAVGKLMAQWVLEWGAACVVGGVCVWAVFSVNLPGINHRDHRGHREIISCLVFLFFVSLW